MLWLVVFGMIVVVCVGFWSNCGSFKWICDTFGKNCEGFGKFNGKLLKIYRKITENLPENYV